MGEVKNLEHQEAIKKVRDLAEKIDICMFCTNLGKKPFDTRPMSTQEVDEEGNIWFFSAIDSHKSKAIMADDHVQLLYAHPGDSHYMTVHGRAKIIRDREKTEELWNVFIKAWFQKGKDDPQLTLIKVSSHDAYYWDTKHGKMISLMKVAASVVTGKPMDDGIEGKIKM